MFRRSHRPRYRLLEQKLRRNTSMGIFKNRQRRRLVIQQLEPRRVLANMMVFDFNLFEDDGGVPGDVITDNTVFVDQTFYLQLTVQDVRDPSAQGGSSTLTGDNIDANEAVGVSSFAGNIFWDPAKFEEIDDPFDVVNMVVNGQINMNYHNLLNSNFRTLRSGTLDNTAGSIEGIGGGIGLGNAADIIGQDGPEQLSLFHFRAEAPATDSIISMSGGGGMADLAEFEPVYAEQFINVISGVSPVLSIVDATITEVDSGTPTLVFDVILSEASQSQVSVDFTTVDITAVAQDGGSGDYVAVDGTLIFESGQTLQQISVPIVGDIIPEDTETFSVQLSNLNDNGANPLVELGNDTAIGTIHDTDVGLTVSINDPSSIVEGDSGETTLMFEVAISGEPSSDVMVDFTTGFRQRLFSQRGNAYVRSPRCVVSVRLRSSDGGW